MGYIDEFGTYHKGPVPVTKLYNEPTKVWKQSDHDRQRQDHKWELIKPYLENGEPNPEFIAHYPEEAQEAYKFIKSNEQIAKEQRSE